MKLNLDFQIKSLDGKDVPGDNGNASKGLGACLASSNKGNSIKLHAWALKLWNKEPIEIDKTDKEMLEAIVDTTEFLTVLAKVPILNAIKDQYENDGKGKAKTK